MNLTPTKIMFALIFFVTLFLAVYFRIIFFTADRPLWIDEASLALNIVDKSWLCAFKPLLYAQAAPPLFLVLSKMFSEIMPDIEMALRTLPFICSLISIGTFYLLCKKILKYM